MQLRIEDGLQFVCRRKPREKSWLTRRSRLAIGNEDRIHRHSDRGVYVDAFAHFAGDRRRDLAPIFRHRVGTGFMLPSARLEMRQRQSR